ncbi:MAG: PIN domain-containing protein [Patescibacteria group bacterium]|nr:PIN domain-containing protein [Patescibacteria group bacterium]
MDRVFIDTNYFIRLIIGEPLDQNRKANKLFREGALSNIQLFTTAIVVFEIYWVLSSFYKKDKKQISSVLIDILRMNFIDIENRDILLSAVKTYCTTSLDLEDSYNLCFARSKKANIFATFDKRLCKISGRKFSNTP